MNETKEPKIEGGPDAPKPDAPKPEVLQRKPTIEELERMLDADEESSIEILPNGEIRMLGGSTSEERRFKKPLTMREDLGGEYAEAA